MRGGSLRILAFAGATVLSAAAAHAETTPAAEMGVIVALDGWRNLQGGLRRGSVLLVTAQFGMKIDAEQALGWRGATLGLSGSYNDKATVSGELVGDWHGVDNLDASGGIRLFEAWLQQDLPGGYGKVGLVDLNSEFNVNRTAALFINGAHGLGLDMAQLGWGGPSVYPRARAAALVSFGSKAAWKLGLFSGAPAPADQPAQGHPVLAVTEFSREIAAGRKITLGAWVRSADYGNLFGEHARRATGGGYVLVEHRLWSADRRELDGFVRFGAGDAKSEPVASDLNLGLVMARPFLGREGEALGFAVLSSRTSDHFHRKQVDHTTPAPRETVVEATYRLPISQGLAFQPDVQYIARPAAAPSSRDALVIGFRLEGAWRAGL